MSIEVEWLLIGIVCIKVLKTLAEDALGRL